MHAQKEVKANRGRRPMENEHVKAMKTLILQLRFKWQKFLKIGQFIHNLESEPHSEPCQTCKIVHFLKIVIFKTFTFFAKGYSLSFLGVKHGPEIYLDKNRYEITTLAT